MKKNIRSTRVLGTFMITSSSVGFLSNSFLTNKNTISTDQNNWEDIFLNSKDLTEKK